MNNILTITESNIHRFDYDVVTHDPIRIGDRVAKCHNCRAILKVGYISHGCPLCGATPFVADSLDAVRMPRHRTREYILFATLLCAAVYVSMLPMYIDSVADLVCKSAFGLDPYMYTVTTAAVASVLMYCIPSTRRAWAHENWGWLLACVPAIAPYVLLLAVWCVIGVVSLVIGIAYLALCIAIVVGVISIISGG